ncbi:hypothetical protein ABK040_016068 [Willaertia magna]
MKVVASLCLVVLLAATLALCIEITEQDKATPAIHFDLIKQINRNKDSTWKAGINKKFIGKSVADVKRLLGVKGLKPTIRFEEEKLALIERYNKAKKYFIEKFGFEEAAKRYPALALPDNFDSRQKWPTCIHAIRNQEQCGSCWAFSASEVLSDRFCIDSNGKVNVTLSPQYLVSCDSYDLGCDGGNLNTVWSWMKSYGIVTDNCLPYTSGNGDNGVCPASTCADNKTPLKQSIYFAKSYEHISPWIEFWKRPEMIQTEILNNGPVQAAFSVYQDFMNYKSGVYRHTSGSFLGGHAIKIVGWGVENNVPYWLVNSWGTDWGLGGFFKILRGSNEVGIEDTVYAGPADLSRLP